MTPTSTYEGVQMGPHWAGYIRVSTESQKDGFSPEIQREKIESFAEERGFEIRIYSDLGISGELLPDQRPGMGSLLAVVDAGEVEGVVVCDESRLARNTFVAAYIKLRLSEAGAKLAMPGRGVLDLNDPTQEFHLDMTMAANAYEQRMRTRKMTEGLREAAEAGYWPGGPAPYGYRRVRSENDKHTALDINPDEVAVLHLVADLIVNKGYTTYSASAYLNEAGYRTRTDSRWRHPNLSRFLRKEHLTGTWVYDPDGLRIPIAIPAIFTVDQWEALQSSIRGGPGTQRRHRLYPLTGRGRVHLRCSCGGNFYGYTDTSKKSKIVYECSRNQRDFGDDRCPHLPRTTPAEALEAEVFRQVRAALTDPDYLKRLAGESAAAAGSESLRADEASLERRLATLRAKEDRIIDRLAEDDQLHGEAIRRGLDRVEADRETVEKELNRIRGERAMTMDRDSIEERTRVLVERAISALTEPTPELMATLFDVVELEMVRVEGRTFEGVAHVPLPESGVEGEVCEGGLRPSTWSRR